MLTSASPTELSLADVFPSCLSALGVDSLPNRLGLGPAQSAVVLLIDGLGELNLSAHRAHARFLSSAVSGGRLSTVFPSTTASALTSLTTGVLPGQHGIVGYKVRDPDSGNLINQLRDLGNIANSTSWVLKTPLYFLAHESGIESTVISHPRLKATALTHLIHAGAAILSESSIESRFTAAVRLVTRGHAQFVVVYVSELDEAAHKHGINSQSWTVLLEQLDRVVSDFTAQLPRNVGVVLTADHGVIDIPSHKHILYGTREDQMAGITRVGGEPRCLQLFLDDETDTSSVIERWSADFGYVADVFPREHVIGERLLGEVHPDARARMGDVFVIARKQVVFYDARDAAQVGRTMIGQHGALSEEELRIPFLRWGAFA